MKRKRCMNLGLLLGLLLLPLTTLAEPKAFRLNLEAVQDLPDAKAAFIKGTTTKAGDRYYVEHLMLNQPVMVRVFAPHKSDVSVGLSKFRWDEFEQQVSTKGSGLAEFKVRTQGEMRLVIQSDEPDVPYYAAVLVGDEIQPQMRPVVTSAAEASGGFSLMWIGLGALLAGVVVAFVLSRRKSA